MIELVPWMLILVWWHPDDPGTFDVRREPHLFASEAECRMHGANRVAGTEMYHLEHGDAKVTFHCTPVPGSAEYDALFAAIDEAKGQDEPEMQNNPDATPGEGQ
jgi:hypothetical protein